MTNGKKWETLDWGNEAAVKAFNSFQESLKSEEGKLASLETQASRQQKEWDFDGVGTTNLRRYSS